MTAENFKRTFRRNAGLARQNFLRDGYLQPTLLLWGEGQDAPHIFTETGPISEDESRQYAADGINAVPGPFRDYENALAEAVQYVNGYAAMLLNEAWLLMGDEASAALQAGTRATDNPLREEVLIFLGSWPREKVMLCNVDRIHREKTSTDVRLEANALSEEFSDNAGTVAGWLFNILPD